jgi:hypothetical protein
VTDWRLVDLDDPGDVELLWQRIARLHAVRQIDPELRVAIVRRCNALPPSTAAPIRELLDELHPEAVLEAHFRTLVPDRPTIGAIRRRRQSAGADG